MVTCLLAGFGFVCWPQSIGTPGRTPGRWRRSNSASLGVGESPAPLSARSMFALIVVVALVISAISGWMVGMSASLLLVTLTLLVRSEFGRRREQLDLAEVLAATRTLSREVRAGAGPAAAIRASADAHRGSALILEALAIKVATDRGRPSETVDHRIDAGLAAEITGRLVRGWSLSAKYGVPWAALIDTVSVDLADRVRARSQRNAQVSGPRVSGYVLALMPGLGVVLGAGMGANPLRVLFGSGPGHLLLLVGTALTCAGLAWTARIVDG